jgi:hypothetical protein
MPRVRISKSKQAPPICLVTGSTEGVGYERVDFVFVVGPEGRDDRDVSSHIVPKELLKPTTGHVDWTTLSLPFTGEGLGLLRSRRKARRLLYAAVPALALAAIGAVALIASLLGMTDTARAIALACGAPFAAASLGLALYLRLVPHHGVPRVVKNHLRDIELDVPNELAAAMIGAEQVEEKAERNDRLGKLAKKKRPRVASDRG